MTDSRIRNLKTDILSDNWYTLKKATFEYLGSDGKWQRQQREVYDRGNGAAILLFNREKQTILLIRQFRIPTYMNGNSDGMLIEACAGLLDEDEPEACIKREVEEETGYKIDKVCKVFEAYMSPGAVTEIIHFFTGEYTADMKVGNGGGLASEHEDIEVLEISFDEALLMIADGRIKDAKTIMLLLYAQTQDLLNDQVL